MCVWRIKEQRQVSKDQLNEKSKADTGREPCVDVYRLHEKRENVGTADLSSADGINRSAISSDYCKWRFSFLPV